MAMANIEGANSSSSYSSSSSENPRKDIEEVWKDISLSNLQQDMPLTPTLSLQNNNQTFNNTTKKPTTTTSTSFRGIILQDFLSEPFVNDSSALDQFSPPSNHSATLTSLQLNSGHFQSSCPNPANVKINGCKLRPKKRSAQQLLNESIANGNCDSLDQIKKRMIKNRESAARSRARKQAYTNELEIEVAQLITENKKLRRQYEELLIVMTAETMVVNKRKLQRTFTAPF